MSNEWGNLEPWPGIVTVAEHPTMGRHLREHALEADYLDFTGFDGETYKRISMQTLPALLHAVEHQMGPVHLHATLFRANYGGELPNAAIHADYGWGTHVGVLYLSEGETGTAFWQHLATGQVRINKDNLQYLPYVEKDWNDTSKWRVRTAVQAKLGRLIIYEADLFHSRFPFSADGQGMEDGRLSANIFFTPKGTT